MDYQFKEMEYEEDLFQKIINREFPTEIIFEDDSVFAFEWINPVAPTHILIIPKKKVETLNDITDEDKEILRDDEKDSVTIPSNTAVVEEGN